MVRFEIPQKMIHWTLWAIWWLIIGSAVLWTLVGSVAYWVKQGWTPHAAAGWVQAVGSLVAIVVAVAIPIYLRAKADAERLREKSEHDIARSERLLALCIEGLSVVQDFDHEAVFADYDANNALRQAVLNDLLHRLNEAQIAELNAKRMKIGMRLRSCLYDWLKYFGGKEITDHGRLHDRVERMAPWLERVKIDAENIVRNQKGLPLLVHPKADEPDDDLPF